MRGVYLVVLIACGPAAKPTASTRGTSSSSSPTSGSLSASPTSSSSGSPASPTSSTSSSKRMPEPEPPDPRNDPPVAASAPLDGRLLVQPPGMCGGARAPMDYRRPPHAPLGNAKVAVVAGDKYTGKHVTQLTTAADGTFSAALRPGKYCIVIDNRGAKPASPPPNTPTTAAPNNVDQRCLVDRWEKCDAVVDVPLKQRVDVAVSVPCAWTVCYFGPPPP